jgi:cell division transport system ATP-binding protein
MIELKNVSKKYRNGTHALHDVSLKVNDGEFIYIMGPTGSGKSTLIKLLDGEEVPTSGSVLVSGINVGRLKKSKVYLYRRKIGVVFQDYRLLPEKTVFENVAYALEILDMPDEKIRKRVREVLKLVDLADKSNAKPHELSGGQQQRTAIARAIAKKPTILIADEPTGNLDPDMTNEMIKLLEKINREEKTTLLVVTHNDVMVEYHPKRTIRIDCGHVVNDGTRNEAFYKHNFSEVKPVSETKETVKEETAVTETAAQEAAVQEAAAAEVPVQEAVSEEAAVEELVQQTMIHEAEAESHEDHVPSESEALDQKLNEVAMQQEAIREIREGEQE